MKLSALILMLGFAASGSLLAADAPQIGVSESVRVALDVAERQFLSAAEAMPEKLYTFAPKGSGFEGVRTFAEQVKHVACGQFGYFAEIEHKAPPEHCEKGGPTKASTKAELLQYLRESFEYGNKVLAAMTEASAREKVQGQYWGNNSSLTVAIAAVWHLADHYGQIVPYLRMNNIVPPPTERYPVVVR
jgi:hypothetical protein